MTKAILYCRVSSDRQVKEGHGLDSQEKRCRDYAKSKGYQVLEVFRDEGESGGLFDRTAMKQLLKFLGEHDSGTNEDKIVVIFDDLKRFARDTEVHFGLKREIYGRNGRVESPNFRFEDTPEGKFVETIMAATAALERDQNKRQVVQKMKARLELGYWPFCMPKGLINQKHPIHGKILVGREPYATIYKEGIEKYRDGLFSTIGDFQLFVNEQYEAHGIKHRMSFSTATETLKEILYAGYIEYPKWGIPRMKAQHDGFISLETYELVQERFTGKTKPWRRRDYHLDFPLRPHVLCATCGTPMTGSYHTGRNGVRNPHYYCRRNKKECVNGNRNIRKKVFEEQFEILLSGVKPADADVDLTKDVLQEQWDERFELYVAQRQKIAQALSESTEEIDRYVERIGKTRDEEMIAIYEEKVKALKKKKEDAEQDLNKKLYTPEQFGTASEKVFNTLKNPMSMWKSPEYNDKKTILYMYFGEQLQYDYEKGFGTATLSTPLRLINTIKDDKKSSRTDSVEMSGSEPECE